MKAPKEDYYVCEMCGEPPYSNGDGSMQDMEYCLECSDHTTFVLMSEFEAKENGVEDDGKLAEQERRWEADNDR